MTIGKGRSRGVGTPTAVPAGRGAEPPVGSIGEGRLRRVGTPTALPAGRGAEPPVGSIGKGRLRRVGTPTALPAGRGAEPPVGSTAVIALVVVAACSGKGRPDEAAPIAPPRADAELVSGAGSGVVTAAASDAATGAGTDAATGAGTDAARDAAIGDAAGRAIGDLQVRVVWPDVPAAARRSPGRTPCNTPRAPSVAPTTTWGVPDALVVVDGAPAGTATARVSLADCALTPRIAVGASLAITSWVDRPARLVLRKRGTLDALAAGDPIPVLLPIAGHTVATDLDAGAIYSIETDAADPELAFVATLPGSHLTDAAGQTVVHALPAGAHAVTAWLPPRAGQPVRLARGTAQIKPGALTELTLTFAP
jgi:hypothetical protein